jgi:hypothetical protein
MDDGVERTAHLFRKQAAACRELGSPLYGALLEHAADDLLAGGVVREVVDGHLQDPGPSALALRVLGGAHALVLSDDAPALAVYYPSAGGHADPGVGAVDAWQALAAVLRQRTEAIRAWLGSPPQTNEVSRGAALVGGLCHLDAIAPLPVHLVEIGASAGLNLRADRFHIAGDVASWGDPDSPVVLPHAWQGAAPPPTRPVVVSRIGGDVSPVDPTTAEGKLRLMAYVWPDQVARVERLRGALVLAERVPAILRREAGAETVTGTSLQDGSWTVLWHSVMWMYLTAAQKAEIVAAIEALGATATPNARLAHLSLEARKRDDQSDHEWLVTMTTWPGGDRRVLGVGDPHGGVRWEQ